MWCLHGARSFAGRGAHGYRVIIPLVQRCSFQAAQAAPASSIADSPEQDPRDAVVKIFNTRQRPGWTVPWQMQPVESSTGSGAVIFHNKVAAVLTAAHVVADTRYLQIQRSTDRFSSEKFRAHVLAVCHEVDLALLLIEDEEALQGITPLDVAAADLLPLVFEKVHVVGYPVGGDAVSVTEGVVSRVEVQEYSHSHRAGLALTVDAAINSGNSGGPVLDAATARIVGVAFQKLVARGVELQGHAVPSPLIQRFLQEVQAATLDEQYSSSLALRLRMPSLGCSYQSLEPPALRRALGLSDQYHGVLLNRLHYSDVPPSLHAGDVLFNFNGLELDDLGFCGLLGRRLHFAAACDLCRTSSLVPMTVWRDGHAISLEHKLNPTQHFVPRGQYDAVPPFFVIGGLVLQPLTHEYLQGWNAHDRPSHLQELFLSGHVQPERTEAVMLSQVLSDQANAGYDSGWVGAPLVRAVNGQRIRNLEHLVSIVRAARKDAGPDEFLCFDVDASGGPFRVVLPVEGLDEADRRVHAMYGVPEAGCSVHFRVNS